MSNFYISDLHLNHKNVTAEGKNFDNRPFQTMQEMHEKFKENWNSEVTNADTVYLLGDIIWKLTDEMIGLFSQLKGKKVAIVGNHDQFKDVRYKQLFTEICDYKEVTDNINGVNRMVVLSHFPILMWNGQHKGWIHLYGHVHNSQDEALYQASLKMVNDYYKDRDGEFYKPFYAYNVGCMMDYMNYTPRTLSEIVNAREISLNNLRGKKWEKVDTL